MVLTKIDKSIDTRLFEAVVDMFKEKSMSLFIRVLMPLIDEIKNYTEEIERLRFEYENNPHMILSRDTDEIYDIFDLNSDRLKYLLEIVKKHKDDDPMFLEYYNVIDKAITALVMINFTLSDCEAQLMNNGELKYAS